MDWEELKRHREAILAIAEKHGAGNVRVFGSTVRGESSASSDIDLLVTMEQGRSLMDHTALWQELEDCLGHPVDVVSEKALHWYIRDEVLKEAVAL